jgi:hypothetical protein
MAAGSIVWGDKQKRKGRVMSLSVTQHERSRALRISDYLQHLDYRIARLPRERDEIFRLRYKSYLRDNSIAQNNHQRFSDDYDNMENCRIFGIYADDWLIASIRFHVIGPEHRQGPALDVFPDLVWPMVQKGMVVIDPTRFVVDETASREYLDLPFLTLRVACMASEFFEADYCLATVRKEHSAFYRRVFNSQLLCEPRPYPTLTQPICLMRADVRKIRDTLMRRYPVFLSSLTERRMLFENPPAPVAQPQEAEHYFPMVNGAFRQL